MGSPIYEEIRQRESAPFRQPSDTELCLFLSFFLSLLQLLNTVDCKFLIKPIKRNRLHHTLRIIFPIGDTPNVSSPGPSTPAFPANLSARIPLAILCAEDNPIK